MLLRRVVVLSTLFCAAAAAYGQTADFSGTWKGTLTEQLACPGGGTVPSTLTLTTNFSQSANAVTGNAEAVGPHDACISGTPVETVEVSFSGSVSGSTLSGTYSRSGESGSFTATLVTISSMNFTLTFPDGGKASGPLTRSVTGPPSTDSTGSWGGTVSVTDHCGGNDGNVPQQVTQWSSPSTLLILQQQGAVSGALILYAVPDHGTQCQVVGTFSAVLPFSGQISGNTLSGTLSEPGGSSLFTATISGSSMSLTGSAGFQASATLTRVSTQAPDASLSGSYDGSYSAVFTPCPGQSSQLPSIAISGSFSGPLTQIGAAAYATITVAGQKRDHATNGQCTVTDAPPEAVTMSGQISGNSMNGLFFGNSSNDPNRSNNDMSPFNATISGNTITGTFDDGTGTFTMTRTGSPPTPPQILSFLATPPTIRAGQPVTLSWATIAATTATIDNGIGGKPASGSVTITPTATTTYTLSAVQGTETATATVKVEVLTGPIVNVTTIPATMLQVEGGGGAKTTYALANAGSASTTITFRTGRQFLHPVAGQLHARARSVAARDHLGHSAATGHL